MSMISCQPVVLSFNLSEVGSDRCQALQPLFTPSVTADLLFFIFGVSAHHHFVHQVCVAVWFSVCGLLGCVCMFVWFCGCGQLWYVVCVCRLSSYFRFSSSFDSVLCAATLLMHHLAFSLLLGFLFGWHCSAFFVQAFFSSFGVAFSLTPRTW